jgi:acetolactate synthase-1/3 small subunit
MTIVASGDERILEQIVKQLEKLIDTIKVVDITDEDIIDRELVMIKVNANATSRHDVMQIVNTFRAKILDVQAESLTVEVTGGEGKIDAMVELLKPYGILETVRTGIIALSRKVELRAPGSAISAKAKSLEGKKVPRKTKAAK